MVIFYGLGSHGIHHHEKPPFGEYSFNFVQPPEANQSIPGMSRRKSPCHLKETRVGNQSS